MNLTFLIGSPFLFYSISIYLCNYISNSYKPTTLYNKNIINLFKNYKIFISLFVSLFFILILLKYLHNTVLTTIGVLGIIYILINQITEEVNNKK